MYTLSLKDLISFSYYAGLCLIPMFIIFVLMVFLQVETGNDPVYEAKKRPINSSNLSALSVPNKAQK